LGKITGHARSRGENVGAAKTGEKKVRGRGVRGQRKKGGEKKREFSHRLLGFKNEKTA